MIALGALGISLGILALRKANEHYDALKEADKPELILGLGIGGAITLLIGVIVMLKAVSKRQSPQLPPVEERRGASPMASVGFTLFGLALGAMTCLYMFAASAARHIETVAAQQFHQDGQMIALIVLCLSLLFGLAGLFLRGYALGRVPVYFFVGGVITYFTAGFAKMNLLEWQPFVATLQ